MSKNNFIDLVSPQPKIPVQGGFTVPVESYRKKYHSVHIIKLITKSENARTALGEGLAPPLFSGSRIT